jgi:predicted ArsR family transcriptional regulator
MQARILADLKIGQSSAASMGDMLDIPHSKALHILKQLEEQDIIQSKEITTTQGKKLTVFQLP